MELNQLNKLGSGMSFPIKLTTLIDEQGKEVTSWVPERSPDLVQQNLLALLSYAVGQKFREEYFGTRIWECIEEPNEDIMNHVLLAYLKESIATWEPRIEALGIQCEREGSALRILLRYKMGSIQQEASVMYNL